MSLVKVNPQAMVARVLKLAGFDKPESGGMMLNIARVLADVGRVDESEALRTDLLFRGCGISEYAIIPVTVEPARASEVAGAIRKCPHYRFKIAGELMIALPLQLKFPDPEIAEGWWWARCRWNGDLEVVHVKANVLREGFRVDIPGTEEPFDGDKLLREYELIERIKEPA